MPHMEGIFINGEKAKFHPEDILDTDASQYTEEIGESVTAYLTEHITNPSNPPIDTSLSIAGAAADAKKTGDEISQLKSDLNKYRIANIFDGILYNGYWNSSGVLTSSIIDVCNKNKIDCPAGADVSIEAYTSVSDAIIYISYLDDNGRIRRDDAQGKSYRGVAPTGTKWVCFCFEKSGITKDNFGTVSVYINDQIYALGVENDAQNTDISNIETELMTKTYVSITNDIVWSVDGYYSDGNLKSAPQQTTTAKTAFLTVRQGDKFKISGHNNYHQKLLCLYDQYDNLIAVYSPDNENRTYTNLEVTIPDGVVKIAVSYYNATALAEFSLYQEKWIAKNYVISGNIGKDDVEFIDYVHPENLYDATNVTKGKAVKPSDGSLETATGMCVYLVPIVGSGDYSLIIDQAYYGTNGPALKIYLYDSDDEPITYVTATILSGSGNFTKAKIAITDTHIANGSVSFAVTVNNGVKNQVMAVKASTYPETYSAYFTPYYQLDTSVLTETDNPLYGKTMVFDGDSICNASSAADGSAGWASRIGISNKANWKNYGVGGGCITYIDGSGTHCISRNIETIHTAYPTLDYLILEGGTNDADRLHSDSAKIGTIDPTDYSGTYDDTTYCGALDTLFFKALSYYPKAKIGFIIAPKMGTNSGVRAYRYEFFELAMQACEKWGIAVINLWNGSQLNPSLSSMYDDSLDESGNRAGGYLYTDGQHLTAYGYEAITPKIEAWMKTL